MAKKLLIVETRETKKSVENVLCPSEWDVSSLGKEDADAFGKGLVCKLVPLRIEYPGEKVLRNFKISGEYHDAALYENNEGQRKALTRIRMLVGNHAAVYLATKAGLIGETYAWHLQRILRIKNPKRVVFHASSEIAIRAGLAQSRAVIEHLAKSYEEHFSSWKFLEGERSLVNSPSAFASYVKAHRHPPRWAFDDVEIKDSHELFAEMHGPFIERLVEDHVNDLADTASKILSNPDLSTLEKQAMLNDLEKLAFGKRVHNEPRKSVLALPNHPKNAVDRAAL